MGTGQLASVVINNYNYAPFLAQAIDGALRQTHPATEVIVVDDGSTDESAAIIEGYGDRIVSVRKQNGGQASALNAGFAASRGDVVLFLDADDVLFPEAAAAAVALFDSPDVVKVHWPLQVIDASGRSTGRLFPRSSLPDGDLREMMLEHGPLVGVVSPPMSGNAWARRFLQDVMPIPESDHVLSADAYLYGLAPAFGMVRRIAQPQGCYRLHGRNNYWGKSLEERAAIGCRTQEQQWRSLARFYAAAGISVDQARWESHSWYHRLRRASEELAALLPPGELVVLIDRNRWATDTVGAGCRCIPFLERRGQYWGPPPDSVTAIRELGRLRERGASFAVIAWPAFWWLDHFADFGRHVRSTFRCVLENERLKVYDLRQTAG